jgi:hypothetical protein
MKRENMSEIETEVAEAAAESTSNQVVNSEEVNIPNQFTAEDIAKARAQEKAKLYPQVEKLQEELALLKQREQERDAKDAERKAQRAVREAELAKKKKEDEEQELSLKDLLVKKEQELTAQIEQERAEREKALALLDQERKFQELMQFRQQRLEAERENIIPELIDLIQGNSKDEIEQSINGLKDKSAKIFESVAQASQQTRKEMVGSRITAPASGPLDNDSEQRSYSPDDISNMSLSDYAKNRAKLLGNASNNRGQGLFG